MAEIIAIVATVASVAVSAYSAISSSQAEEHAEHKNERIARANAAQAVKAAAQREGDFRSRSLAALSAERMGRAKSGVTMEGTPLLTFYENMRNYEEDALRIREGGEIQENAWLQKASLHGAYGEQAGQAGSIKAGATILTGATSIFDTGRKAGWWGNAPTTTQTGQV